ncbi:membrane protein YqaE [Enterobacter cloacae]|uniref:Membrane protein YqaE n=1 Tax=Enterobacter cloacae TaxID=550 RepID=A0A377LVA2_ENTCL|nr:membrane protein YqaE [Enterobacter cloacae]
MGFWRVVFTIILPPLGVLLGKGLGWAFIPEYPSDHTGLLPWTYPRVLGSDEKTRCATVSRCRSRSVRPAAELLFDPARNLAGRRMLRGKQHARILTRVINASCHQQPVRYGLPGHVFR